LSQRYRPRHWLAAEALLRCKAAEVRCFTVASSEPRQPAQGHCVALARQALLITDFYDNLSVAAGGALLAPFSQQVRHSAVQPADANRFLSGALQPRRPPRRLPGLSLSLLSLWAVNYYHWLFEALPRLELIRRSGLLPTGARPTLLLPEPLSPFHLASLEALGLADWPRQLVGPQGFLRCEQLLLADLPSPDCSVWTGPAGEGGIEAWVVAFLRRTFLDPAFLASGLESAAITDGAITDGAIADGAIGNAAVGETCAGRPADGRPLRLYLSRAGESRRGVRDEALILPLLERHGIRRLDPGQLSLAQQVHLFSRASWVIAPHGAALANLAFCPAGTLVVELFSSGFQPGMYASLSQRIGARYHALTAPAEVGAATGSAAGAADDDPSLVGDRRPLRFSPALLHALEEILSDA
jgi:capsular polysaccharide biosynthesis protein